MKKFFAALFLGAILSLGGFLSPVTSPIAYAAIPSSDTWVMEWNGDIYVKAGTLRNLNPPHTDAAPNFDVTIARVQDGQVSIYNCEFRSKGMLLVKVNGSVQSGYYYEQLYEAIVDKFRSEFY